MPLILEQTPGAIIELLIVNTSALGDVQHIFDILFVFLKLQLKKQRYQLTATSGRSLGGGGGCTRNSAKFKQSIVYTVASGYSLGWRKIVKTTQLILLPPNELHTQRG